jgi:hypothetical protein
VYTGLDGTSKTYPLCFIKLGTSMCHQGARLLLQVCPGGVGGITKEGVTIAVGEFGFYTNFRGMHVKVQAMWSGS